MSGPSRPGRGADAGDTDPERTGSPASRHVATRLAGIGRRLAFTSVPGLSGSVVNPPVWRASTHLYDDTAALRAGTKDNADGQFFYGRRGGPTQWSLAEALSALEPGAAGTVLFPSGVAAIAGALMASVRPGERLLITDNAYDPSRRMGLGLLARFGVQPVFFDPLDLEGFRELCAMGAGAVLLESPGSLTMEICDVTTLAGIARAAGAMVLLDNTWAGPTGFQALAHGCDGAILALTKHVGGHSDLMMGSVTANKRLYPALRTTAQALGQVVSPDDAALALRGLRTLDLRLRQQAATALVIARWLRGRDEVAAVLCPMLDSAPGHDLWQRDFSGGCGLFSFVLKGQDDAARARLIDALTLFGIGYSWGGYESLVLPVDPGRDRSVRPWPPAGLDAGDRFAIRLSIGLEHADDLIADLAQAFATMRAA
ncbi:cystathionine beta-lyase [Croceicoccus sp. F390]|uniref:Cystathionine beta-lyase n=1 Tax=Croceicoccus esteveae TaxID=3075597 RepID=A0ABU2ZGB4_9SPHN|nr:cystathionine beta-lyase [Croceicoccus sp. F390]MDT0575632.1 cystathionine beta-lyase [Croceicoccus sp. F390]